MRADSHDPVVASVVVPYLDEECGIEACLRALLAQRPGFRFEVIAIDNGSSDGSAERVAALAREDDRLVRHEDPVVGIGGVRNAGLHLTRGVFLLFTDADAVVQPGWIEALVGALSDPSVRVAGTEVASLATAGLVSRFSERWGVLQQRPCLRDRRGPFLATVSFAARRTELIDVGGFDAQMFSGSDVDLSWRLTGRRRSAFRLLDEPRVQHRHRDSVYGLYTQFHKYGTGYEALRRKHGTTSGFELRRVVRDLLVLASLPARTALGLPEALRHGDPLPVLGPVLRGVQVLGHRRGELSAVRRGQDRPRYRK